MSSEQSMGKQIVTSIKVDEDIWKKLKIAAIENGVTAAEFLNKAIEDALKKSK